MQTERIVFDRDEARKLWRAYQTHKHYSEPVDEEISRIYQAIANGHTVIRAIASIVAAGLHVGGPYEKLPKLAICRADQTSVAWRGEWGRGKFSSPNGSRKNAHPSHIVQCRWPGMTGNHPWGTAKVPTVPLHIRPKRGLANYHILWEAEWQPIPPGDPILLRRIGQADAWLVVAAWDLTPVEQAVFATRMNS